MKYSLLLLLALCACTISPAALFPREELLPTPVPGIRIMQQKVINIKQEKVHTCEIMYNSAEEEILGKLNCLKGYL